MRNITAAPGKPRRRFLLGPAWRRSYKTGANNGARDKTGARASRRWGFCRPGISRRSFRPRQFCRRAFIRSFATRPSRPYASAAQWGCDPQSEPIFSTAVSSGRFRQRRARASRSRRCDLRLEIRSRSCRHIQPAFAPPRNRFRRTPERPARRSGPQGGRRA